MCGEIILGGMTLLSMGALLGFFTLFGARGLFVYCALAGVIANIQVVKATLFCFSSHPVALGTVVFSSIFTANDILTAFYGPKVARQNVHLGLLSMILALGWLMLTLSYPIAPGSEPIQNAMEVLFIPHVALTCASLIAYVLSQYTDIAIFYSLRHLPLGLGLRSLCSTALAGFMDQMIFSILAWSILNPSPLPLYDIWWTYIVGTYGIRLGIGALQAPVVKIAQCLRSKPREEKML